MDLPGPCRLAPISQPAADALRAWADEAATAGATAWPKWSKQVEAARQFAARIVGAAPEEIALVPNTTAGISLVAEGFPWQPGDNVVAPAEFAFIQKPLTPVLLTTKIREVLARPAEPEL